MPAFQATALRVVFPYYTATQSYLTTLRSFKSLVARHTVLYVYALFSLAAWADVLTGHTRGVNLNLGRRNKSVSSAVGSCPLPQASYRTDAIGLETGASLRVQCERLLYEIRPWRLP